MNISGFAICKSHDFALEVVTRRHIEARVYVVVWIKFHLNSMKFTILENSCYIHSNAASGYIIVSVFSYHSNIHYRHLHPLNNPLP